MLLKIFEGARDITTMKKEENITENRTGTIYLPAIDVCNVLITTDGLQGDVTLSIKFEESIDGTTYNEIGTFPVHERRHGIIFAKNHDHVRYTLLVEGTELNLNTVINF